MGVHSGGGMGAGLLKHLRDIQSGDVERRERREEECVFIYRYYN